METVLEVTARECSKDVMLSSHEVYVLGRNASLISQAVNGLSAIEDVVSFISELRVHMVTEQWVKEFAKKDLPVFGLIEAVGVLATLMSYEMEETETILMDAIERAEKLVEA